MLVTVKHFEAGWLLKLQNEHSLSRELSENADAVLFLARFSLSNLKEVLIENGL